MLANCSWAWSCSSIQQTQGFELKNNSEVNLVDKPISIKRAFLRLSPRDNFYPLLLSNKGDTIPSQLDDLDGDHKWDELFFLIDLRAGETKKVKLIWINHIINLAKKTSIRFGVRPERNSIVSPADSAIFLADQLPGVIGYQHYQTDGPTWENDKVAFRLYLDGRNSIDVFGKKVSYITPEDVGINARGVTENNYDTMKDWGTDILAVGNSIGIGGISFLVGDSLVRLGVTEQDTINNVESTKFKILSEGAVKSVMKFTYNNWKPLNRNYHIETTTSIWPGKYAFNNQVVCEHLKGNETLLVGLVNLNTEQPLEEITSSKHWVVLFTYDKQSVDNKWNLGLALVLSKDSYLGYMDAPKTGKLSHSYLAKVKLQNEKPITYYAIAGWELSDKQFKTRVGFKKYLNDFVNQLDAEVIVK